MHILSQATSTTRVRRSLGFTLTALAVVMGIVSVLMALALPVLSVARAKGRGLVCVNNLDGYNAQVGLSNFLQSYIDGSGRANIGDESVIYLFEFSSSINHERDPWADFQDLVALVQFAKEQQAPA